MGWPLVVCPLQLNALTISASNVVFQCLARCDGLRSIYEILNIILSKGRKQTTVVFWKNMHIMRPVLFCVCNIEIALHLGNKFAIQYNNSFFVCLDSDSELCRTGWLICWISFCSCVSKTQGFSLASLQYCTWCVQSFHTTFQWHQVRRGLEYNLSNQPH